MSKPVIILVRPQLGQNIGKAARAMLNFGLSELRIVAPRDGWPNPDAGPSASGADIVLDEAKVFASTEEAVGDLNHVYAATVRPRDMYKSVETPAEAAPKMVDVIDKSETVGIMFGPERSGLNNDDLVLADTIITAPINQEFGSLNLAQAVILVAYEWFKAETEGARPHTEVEDEGVATKKELIGFMEHIEAELELRNYFRTADRIPTQRRSLRNIFQSAGFSSQQVQTLRGVVKSLSRTPEDKK
jgi:tRNA/rRNA methyltransferase